MRNRADLRAVSTVVVAVALIVIPQLASVPAWLVPVWIIASILACCSSHVVVHNHCHAPIFLSDTANKAFNLLATLARGHCASDVFLAHNVNHHVEQGRDGDWIGPRLGGTGHQVVRLGRFIVRATIRMARGRDELGQAGRRMIAEPFRSSLAAEKVVLPIAMIAIVIHDWQRALIFAGLPWGTSLVWLVAVNYIQHEGCDPDSRFAHSRNFTGRFTNWLLFNNGYHTAHHLHPEIHWSEVSQLHAKIAVDVPKELNEPSAARYMLRRFVLDRGARRRGVEIVESSN